MRRLVVVGAVLLALAACAAPQADPGTGNADVATGGRLFATADAETATFRADVGPGVFPRTVTHARGTTTIPAPPTRVAVLDSGELDGVLALGITPVAIAVPNRTVPSYLADKVKGVPIVGDVGTFSIEAVAAAKPDLILGSKLRVDQLYDKLAAIAPTVLSIRPGFPWKEDFLLVGTALGKETAAVDVLNTYQRRVDEVKDTITGTPPTISLVRFMPGRIRLYGNLSMLGVVLADAGLRRPPAQDFAELATEVSEERIDTADGDWIFYSSYGPPANTAQDAVVNGQLWTRLGAVEAGRARQVDDEVWFLGLGPIGVGKVLDDLPKLLKS
jgi:iron complex transport system substrate-binding protein